MAPDKIENGARDVVSTSLIAGSSHLGFPSLPFACIFHSQSFQKVSPNRTASVAASQRCGEFAIHHERDVCEEQHPCGANNQK